MLLAVDVGNSNIVMGGYRGEELCFSTRMATEHLLEADQYAVQLSGIMRLYGVANEPVSAVVMSSVVPQLTPVLLEALRHFSGSEPHMLTVEDAAAARYRNE